MVDQAHSLRTLVRERTTAPSRPGAGARPARRAGVYAITSGKGGVGKSNIALMLAIVFAGLKKKVLLLDADLGLANVHILLGMAPRLTISQVVEGTCSLPEAICAGPAGIDILPGASGIAALANIEEMRLELLMRQLTELESEYDMLVVDTGAGIGSATTGFAMHADTALCVMTPEPTSLADAYAMLKVLSESGAPNLQVVVNMAGSDLEGHQAYERLQSLCRRFLKRPIALAGILPVDREVPRLIRQQRVAIVENPRSAFSVRMTELGRTLAGMPVARRVGFFTRLAQMTGRRRPPVAERGETQ